MHRLASAPGSLTVQTVGDGRGVIEGYASLFNVADSDADVVAPGAFDASLRAHVRSGRQLPILWQHDATRPLGVWRLVKTDAVGLFVSGQLFIHEVAQAAEAYALVKQGALSGLSIGYRPERARRDPKRGVRILEQIRLFEISLVTFPALETARVSAVKEGCPRHIPAAQIAHLHQLSGWLQTATPVSPFGNQEVR